MGRGPSYDHDAIRAHALANPKMSVARAAQDFGCSHGTYARVTAKAGRETFTRQKKIDAEMVMRVYEECGQKAAETHRVLAERGVVAHYMTILRIVNGDQSSAGKRTDARFKHEAVTDKSPRLPPISHPMLTEKRTRYPDSVRSPVAGVLKSGEHSAKIGGKILKGRWAGFPVYTLTLEERATCPTSCRHWRSCWGNDTPWAHRHRHGPELENLLPFEVAALHDKHPHGFVVRLHVLGDFYSVEYVNLWARLIETFPSMRIFGYTARIDGKADPIARALIDLTLKHWDRFAMRFSNAPVDECSTVSIEHPIQNPPDAIICPQQVAGADGESKVESCSLCCLCWETRKRISFVQH